MQKKMISVITEELTDLKTIDYFLFEQMHRSSSLSRLTCLSNLRSTNMTMMPAEYLDRNDRRAERRVMMILLVYMNFSPNVVYCCLAVDPNGS